MKKLIIVLILAIMILTAITPIYTYAYGSTCPVCDAYGYFTGQTKVDWGHIFWLYKCPSSHYWWERQY